MKKFLLLSFAVIALSTLKAQTVDTSYKYAVAVKISPIKAKFSDSLSATHLSVRVVSEFVGGNSSTIHVTLLDKDGIGVFDKFVEITGNQYQLFIANRMRAYTFVANKLNLTILQP